ncbi:hypothetical protein E2320_018036, partial [Naja naja]
MTILCRCENIETSEGVPLYVTGVAQIMTLQPRCEDVETAEGVALTVTGVAQ